MSGFIAISGIFGFIFLMALLIALPLALFKDWLEDRAKRDREFTAMRIESERARNRYKDILADKELEWAAEAAAQDAAEAARANEEGLMMAKLVERGHSASEALRIVERGR